MAGGRIDVHGSAGENAGGALPGAARGMTGGEIVIRGDAGAQAGAAARRGLIVVTGDAGPQAGGGVIAGTVVVVGRAGPRAGRFLKRGPVGAPGAIERPGGARVIDAGIAALGGYAAGLALAEICMGGLGHVDYTPLVIGGDAWPGVRVWTDHPAVSCMASQYAGWAIQVDKYFAMGSGPLRAHARVERELFAKLGYAETARRGGQRPRPGLGRTPARRSTTSSSDTRESSTRSPPCSSARRGCG